MARISDYMIIIIVVCLVFHFTGALTEKNTPNSHILELALNPKDIEASDFFRPMTIILASISIAGVAVGLLTKRYDIIIWVAMFDIFIAFGADLIGIFDVLADVNIPLAIMFVSPLLIIYILAAVEWIRGMS